MPQSKILVDTNTYLRLAKTIRPLLFEPFGVQQYCLYIIPELNHELSNKRLNNKFPWVDEIEYQENRNNFPTINKKQKSSIKQNFDFIWDHVQTSLPGPSRVDARYIAYALELEIPLITDDQDMIALAKEYDVQVMQTLELLKIMHDCEHVSLEMIKGLVEYWDYIKDIPANFKRDYRRLFGKLK